MHLAASAVLGLHVGYVAAVVAWPPLLLGLSLLGRRPPAFRPLAGLHLACLAFAIVQFSRGWACPLTVLEARLRGTPPDDAFTALSRHPEGTWLVPLAGGLWLAASLGALATAERAS